MDAGYINKVSKEIARLESEGKDYWYDFDVSKDKMRDIIHHFSGVYEITVKPCKSCGGSKYDITIKLN